MEDDHWLRASFLRAQREVESWDPQKRAAMHREATRVAREHTNSTQAAAEASSPEKSNERR
jgi:hypothetical protein